MGSPGQQMKWREFLFPEHRTIRWFVRRAGPRVAIQLNADEASFESASKSAVLPTVIYLESNDRIAGVGHPPPSSTNFIPCLIFDSSHCEDRKLMLVEKFLQFGLHTVLGRGITVKPLVTIFLRAPVAPEVIDAMLRKAGAGEVVFGKE
jgi:hypothetical protein